MFFYLNRNFITAFHCNRKAANLYDVNMIFRHIINGAHR